MADDQLLKMQAAAKRASERMMTALLDFRPAETLKVSDVKFIAEWTRTVAFDAIKESQS